MGLPGYPAPADNDEKKGTFSAVRRRARMENPERRYGRGAPRPRGQKRVRMPEVSSSWFFAPNVDDTV